MHESVEVPLGPGMRERLRAVCAALGVQDEVLCRDAVEAAIKAAERKLRASARTGDRPDEQLLARLRVLVAEALLGAASWSDVQARLRERDLAYAPAGGGLELRAATSGQRLCKGSQVGPGYLALIRRFRAPFPGHPHDWLAERALGRPKLRAPTARRDAAPDEDDLIDFL